MDPYGRPEQPTPMQPPASGPSPYAPGSGSLPTPAGYQAVTPPASTPQPAATPALSVDYLDQIATPTPVKAPNRLAVIGLIVGVLAVVVIALLLISSSGGPNTTTQTQALTERITTLQTVATAQQKHLTENSISEANATLSAALSTMNTELTGLAVTKKDGDKKASVTETTYATNLTDTLDAAYQRGTLDRTYTVQMTYELTVLRGMVQKLKTSSSKESIKTFCTNSMANIDLILGLYSNFSATKS